MSKKQTLKQLWQRIDRKKDKQKRRVFVIARDLFQQQSEDVVRKLQQFNFNIFQRSHLKIANQIFDLNVWKAQTLLLLSPEFQKVVEAGFDHAIKQVSDRPFPFPVDDKDVLKTLTVLNNKTLFVPNTTLVRLSTTIRQGLAAAEDLDQIIARVRSLFNVMSRTRALLIAQTSVTSTFERGQLTAFDIADVEMYKWLSQRDNDVRPAHAKADGQIRRKNEKFNVGGEPMSHPGDPRASAKNVAFCRCTLLPV